MYRNLRGLNVSMTQFNELPPLSLKETHTHSTRRRTMQFQKTLFIFSIVSKVFNLCNCEASFGGADLANDRSGWLSGDSDDDGAASEFNRLPQRQKKLCKFCQLAV